MNSRVSFGIKNIFSLASRERCMTNFKRLTIPRYGKIPTDAGSVLVPVCKVGDKPSLLYTVRSTNLRTNSGEVSFPGGRTDQDESPVQTALRETYEEIGLPPDKIDVWGQGPPLPGRNNKIMITPVIGSIETLSHEDLTINVNEIAEVFTVPIEMLCESKNQFYTQFSNGFILPVFVIEEYKIWGITAYITHSFLSSVLTKDVYKNDWMKKKIVLDKVTDK
ncbi:nucleoside diphosphate-linked moiety X motif 8-like [Trichoplusia ni]|uniref:Nucleoside diphosphate-linked moiety X motif 8-like n=1 Tax=Trichoplusia ni TaxID=7111 RepID=A0A7E5X0P7_TRINI|nr:nucleoside diphosphate-linked moiety X motif 8-like [Trichoplusia ni]XP_026746047.1 nucleoside diphosphate-linked moiety X motif 8-like [Trichoplusia ni]